jgi:steroid delta-isomerase-like uncharacterized protein
LIGCQNQSDKEVLEKYKAQSKIEKQNKEIAKEVFAAIDKNDFEKLKQLLADDYVLKVPGLTEPITRDQIFELIKAHYTSFPDWKHKLEDLIAEGDRVSLKTVEEGTHKATYEGIAPTGKKAGMTGFHILAIKNGKVVEAWAMNDNLGFMTQLGMELKLAKGKK